MNGEQLRQYLEFYRDLGVKTLYRRNPLPYGRGSEFECGLENAVAEPPTPATDLA
jgi:hypothetical protein